MDYLNSAIVKSRRLISFRLGVLQNVVSLSRATEDPCIVSMGMNSGDTSTFGAEIFEGRSSGCGSTSEESFLSTIGETVERYSPAFYQKDKLTLSSYDDLPCRAVHPSEYALYHDKQHEFYKAVNYKMRKFDTSIKIYWDSCYDLTEGSNVLCPATYLYLPWNADPHPVMFGSSTGLSAHTNFYKATLTSLYEVIERDSFVITWHQQIANKKIILDGEIKRYIENIFPARYEWHLFDMTYDLKVPSIFAMCFGKSEYGDFVIVATATRSTYGDAIRKAILEVAQSVPYYRYLHIKREKWIPDDDFNKLLNFEDHSLFYNRRPDFMFVFDKWRNAKENTVIDINDRDERSSKEKVEYILSVLKGKNYNVLIKDLSTPDVSNAGFFCIRIVVPQLLQMSGAYPFYHLGGKRLYEVPSALGYDAKDYDNLNIYPHPFP